MKKKLLLICLFIVFQLNAQYQVKTLDFTQYFGDDTVQYNSDDLFSDLKYLPFSFTFYENVFDKLAIGSNGRVTFREWSSGGYSPWQIDETDVLPSLDGAFGIENTIYGLYHDMDNSQNTTGAVYTSVFGEAPFRKFIITYDDITHFSGNCNQSKTTFQIVLFEGMNFIDVHIKNKDLCTSWNEGRAVIGIQDDSGVNYTSPDGRNNFIEELEEESWRFIFYGGTYEAFLCGNSATSISLEDFENLTSVYQLNDTSFSVHTSLADANSNTNPVTFPMDIAFPLQELFVNVDGNVFNVMINSIDCTTSDNDGDGLSASDEDINGNGILSDDDSDNDGIPDFLDSDDDNDYILTNQELVFSDGFDSGIVMQLDTDNDGIPDHIDTDDDNDGILTMFEDTNGNRDYTDDDDDEDGIPNYIDNNALDVEVIDNTKGNIYPNPFNKNIFFNKNYHNAEVKIINIDGQIVLKGNLDNNTRSINTESLRSGVYQVLITSKRGTESYKVLKM
ncbi:T9SS type A sorting domain-containing protein [Aureivirga sp. CE67]|uniref:T9SS type A sorting domain-containing protein n=1 Tax=Aureivirga sp. CE67 TaxID=1788983 RepID=UPI0018C94CC6|nr:T9SS type A sorting domain-containing protein [Aureivirga sp. CE67]